MKKNQKTINLEQTKMMIMNNKNKIKKIIVAQMKKDLEWKKFKKIKIMFRICKKGKEK